MPEQPADEMKRMYRVRPWEINALFVEIILLGAMAGALVMWAGSKMPDYVLHTPKVLWVSLGNLFVGLAIYPVLSIWMRNRHGRELDLRRGWGWLWIVSAVAVGALLYSLMPS